MNDLEGNAFQPQVRSHVTARPGKARWIALLILAPALLATASHPHLATTVAAGCLLGLIFVLTAHSIVAIAIVGCPILLLEWCTSVRSWHSIHALLGNGAATTFEGTLFAGAAVCCLMPYAVARWTGTGLPGSIAASIVGSSIPAGIAMAFFLYIPMPEAGSKNFFSWLIYNTDPTIRFHFEGRVRLDQCHGLPSHHSYILAIPAEARRDVERQTKEPLRELLQQSIGPRDPPRFSCSFAVVELPDGSLELRKECEAETGSVAEANRSPGKFRSVEYEVPMLRPRSPAVIPDKASTVVATAPRGCIADSDPRE